MFKYCAVLVGDYHLHYFLLIIAHRVQSWTTFSFPLSLPVVQNYWILLLACDAFWSPGNQYMDNNMTLFIQSWVIVLPFKKLLLIALPPTPRNAHKERYLIKEWWKEERKSRLETTPGPQLPDFLLPYTLLAQFCLCHPWSSRLPFFSLKGLWAPFFGTNCFTQFFLPTLALWLWSPCSSHFLFS